jgi:phosphate-selective porin
MRRTFIVTLFSCLGLLAANAEEVELTPIEKLEKRAEALENSVNRLQRLKVSGYIQAQYQYAEKDADGVNMKVGEPINAWERAEEDGFGRFGVRRGRIKFTYSEKLTEGVFQLDITERGVSFKDVYFKVKDPWFGTNAITLGVFDRPFGHEIGYSSGRRESPERARIIQRLFPDERDLGAMLTLQGAKDTPWNMFKFEGGMFAGNGIKPQFDSHMDFIGRLSASKNIGSDMRISGGVSTYLGGVRMMNDTVYAVKDNAWAIDSETGNKGKIAKRQYFGVDAQFSVKTDAGLTQLRGEYIFGQHPGSSSGMYRALSALPAPTAKTYMRNINGGYVILTQGLGSSPFTLVAKYDWYNQNTKLSGDDVKATGDLTYNTVGLGAYWSINTALRLTAYYDIVMNEKSKNIADGEDLKDNVFTLRLQYRF